MNDISSTIIAPTPKRHVYERGDLETIFLPIGEMLQISRVTEINKGQLVCEMDVAGHWVFPVHFPSDPIFPGSLLIEAAGQAVAIWAWHVGFRGRPRLTTVSARFESPVGPEDRVLTIVARVRQRKFAFFGAVDLFISDRKIGRVTPMVIVIPDQSALPAQASLF